MSQQVFALLAGINDYAPEVGKLYGCLNDVDHFHAYLKEAFRNTLAAEVLKDGDATRPNIISQFRSHLGKAKAGDVAVFHYCGHGARWKSAAEFSEFYPDGWDEGLVCHDSRRDGGFDLADKELAVLISELASTGAHVAMILDCCHSGSGTRDADAFMNMKSRHTHQVDVERPLDSYLDGYYAALKKQQGASWFTIPTGQHILLAACERTQTAKESLDRQGIFTSTLVEVLQKSSGNPSYAELFVRCRAAVRSRAENQTPQFETFKNFRSFSGFLGRDADSTGNRYNVYFKDGSWTMDAGALHGLPTEPEKGVGLALYTEDGSVAGNATTLQVGPQKSQILPDFSGDQASRFTAEVTSLPLPPVPFYVEGDEEALVALRKALTPAIGADLTDIPGGARYRIEARNGSIILTQRDLNLTIQRAETYSEGSVKGMLSVVKHIVRWERSLALQNHATTMDVWKIDFVISEILENDDEHTYEQDTVTLDYAKAGGEWREVRFKCKTRNRTAQTLHCILAYFSPAYGIHILRNDPVQSGEEFVTLHSDYFHLDEGINQSLEHFKLIVSTEKVDDFLLAQEGLELGGTVSPDRAIGAVQPAKKLTSRNEWFTRHIAVKLVRQLAEVGAQDAALAGGKIVVKSHSELQAKLSMRAAAIPTRAAAIPTRAAAIPTRAAAIPTRAAAIPTRAAAIPTRAAAIPTRDSSGASDFYKALERGGLSMINFAGSRGDNESILELTDIRNAASLKEHPLEIIVDWPLNENEGILPLVFDGEHAFLGGDPHKDENGVTHISVNHLPDIPDNRRSLGGALKLYFFKTYLRNENVNQLRWIDYAPDGSYTYRKDDVAAKVAAARNILLLVHGIIGDTEAMARGIHQVGLHGRFDLVLTYDYENLSTPIEETARKLASQLGAAGIHENDNKRLTLLVHSMGGLVSRWFIEREGGNAIVDHLVMCGTPNNGSPFGRVDGARNIMNVLTGLAVNYLPAVIPFSGALLLLLNRSKKITPTLEQMNPGSEFLKALNASSDPGIRYTILAGDVETYNEPSDGLFGNLLAKIGQSSLFETFFGLKANDIAVSVESILGVTGTRVHMPVRHNVACHHLNYFVSEAGQKALASVEW